MTVLRTIRFFNGENFSSEKRILFSAPLRAGPEVFCNQIYSALKLEQGGVLFGVSVLELLEFSYLSLLIL